MCVTMVKPAKKASASSSEFITIETSKGKVVVKTLPKIAPIHVKRIKELVKQGFYDGIIFHRVIEGFMAQTGDVQFGIKGSPDIVNAGRGRSKLPNLPAEFSTLEYTKGVVGMARSSQPDSANSQFFIMFNDAPFLNGKYTIFGRVISGQNIIDSIKLGTGNNGEVSNPDFMSKVYIKKDN